MNHKIIKTAQKIEARNKNSKHVTPQSEANSTEQKVKKKRQKDEKGSKVYFKKENLKEFESFIEFRERPRKSFHIWKKQIERLEKKAIEQYGVVFPK